MKKTILMCLCLLVLTLPVLMSACSAGQTETASTPRQIVDMAKRNVTIPGKVKAIACMQGPSYEMVFAMGGKNQIGLIRDDHKTAYPLAQLTNPDIKNYKDISNVGPQSPVNIEEFIKQAPDCVIYWNLPQELQKFDSAKIPAVVINWSATEPNNLDEAIADQKNKLKLLSNILGEDSQKYYEKWSKYVDEKVAFVRERTAKIPESQYPTVYIGNSWGTNILATWGAFSTSKYDFTLCGGKWVGVKGPGQFPEVTKEQLIAWAPQAIVVDNHGREPEKVIDQLKTNPDWASLPAVKNNRIYRIPAGVFFLDKGTSVPCYYMWLAQQLHPDVFKDVDMVREVKDYFKSFYNYSLSDEQARNVLAGWVSQSSYDKK